MFPLTRSGLPSARSTSERVIPAMIRCSTIALRRSFSSRRLPQRSSLSPITASGTLFRPMDAFFVFVSALGVTLLPPGGGLSATTVSPACPAGQPSWVKLTWPLASSQRNTAAASQVDASERRRRRDRERMGGTPGRIRVSAG
ncbi:Uncharacterised protein [Acinetobacter baumannii]|nr:Uncharacterised protein [Acinetobacter baumannii]